MSLMKHAKIGRLTLVAVLAISVVGVGLRFASEYRRSHQEGRFVSRIVQEQLLTIRNMGTQGAVLQAAQEWPDEYSSLQTWLVATALKARDPAKVRAELNELIGDRLVSPALRASLNRWNGVLESWANFKDEQQNAHVRASVLLSEGRKHHHEAMGYVKVGRAFDATPLLLWSVTLLSEFIDRDPTSRFVPEALFLLGEDTLQFKRAIPGASRPDRILNLCGEFFPESIWAERAEQLWKSEMTRGV
jgi:hypothetical protein